MRAGGSVGAALVIGFSYGFAQNVRQIVDWWLAVWSTDEQSRILKDFAGGNRFYVLCASLIFTTTVISIFRSVIFVMRVNVAGRRLHNQLLKRVLRATLTFFESNPLGRILNRFFRDVDHMDFLLPETAEYFLSMTFLTLGDLFMIR